MSNGKVFWGIVTAAAAGAIIGLLFAPDEGGKTRKKIKKSANDWATDMLDQLEKGKVSAQEVIEKGKVSAQEVSAKIKANGEHLKEELVGAVEGALDSAKTAINKNKPQDLA